MKRPTLALLLLGGCTVGPDYAGPSHPAPLAEGGASYVNAGSSIEPKPSPWWRALGDPLLDKLVDQALADNRDIGQAVARLRQARAALRQAGAERTPTIGARGSVQRTRPSFAGFGVDVPGFSPRDLTLYDVAIDASWELDLFGGARRGREAAGADAQAAALALDDVRLSIASETVLAYARLRDAQARAALVARNVTSADALLRRARLAHAAGHNSASDIARAEALVATARGDAALIAADRAAALAQLALLTGREPAALSPELAGAAPLPAAPLSVDVGTPAAMLRQRPDVRAAERRIAAETARIGVATAELFPRISLPGTVGIQTNGFDSIGRDAFTYTVGPQIRWNFLDFGRTRARIEAQRGRRDEQLAAYEASVLAALSDAETSIARFTRAGEAWRAREVALAAATRAVAAAELRRRAGAEGGDAVLTAERERLQAEATAASARLAHLEAYARLMKALGLGWQSPAGVHP